MKELEKGIVISNIKLQNNIFSMILELPLISKNAIAGQFIQLYLQKGEMILPRPLSICFINKDKDLINVVYHIVGCGTQVLSKLKAGDTIKVLGPLGNGFMHNKSFNKVALVGGGIGTPPLLQLLRELKLKNINLHIDVYLGFKSKSILAEDFKILCSNLHISTDSGEEGYKGNIIEVIKNNNIQYDEIFSCGPKPMLKNLSVYAESKNISCQISMEERMACGIGACVGCVVEVRDELDSKYKKVCKDGPVFYSREVVWNG